ncbi:MAG: alpha-ketoglutarate-dependent dioxygenase AlkB [Deltaproteobacteria bacterium]|nr:alpha-ketoglutarate-dependent dioxygenase AlkB [Deltaproteobacteria bacterium]
MRPLRSLRRNQRRSPGSYGLHYDPAFLSPGDREELCAWIETLHPLWEQRFSKNNPPPPGREQRQLLRPVYWLGNWQFACLDYYRPPHGLIDRCVRAQPFPTVLARLVAEIEDLARELFKPQDVPQGWHLNTCLVNFYGSRVESGKREDVARVGEHKDFEPGPVASISVGERAFFQFVQSTRPGERDAVVVQQWLDDGSLQLFAGDRFKKHLFHRVQRVDKRGGHAFAKHVEGFETRRVNLTLRYVPDEHVIPFRKLGPKAQEDVRGYMQELAKHAPFFGRELEGT